MSYVTVEYGLRVLHITKDDLAYTRIDGNNIVGMFIEELHNMTEKEFDKIIITESIKKKVEKQ